MASFNEYYPLIPFEFDAVYTGLGETHEEIQANLRKKAGTDGVFISRYILTIQGDTESDSLSKIWQKAVDDQGMYYRFIAAVGQDHTTEPTSTKITWQDIE